MKEAGAVIVDPVSTGIDLVPLLEDTRTNYYEAQFSYDLYFRRLGPDAVIHDVHELIEKAASRQAEHRARRQGIRFADTPPGLSGAARHAGDLKAAVIELMDKYRLDALVHPFKSLPPDRHLDEDVEEKDNPLSSVTGLPALLVPAGYTRTENGPIALEILGQPFAEPTLFKLAYAYEQVAQNRKPAPTTPPLPGSDLRTERQAAARAPAYRTRRGAVRSRSAALDDVPRVPRSRRSSASDGDDRELQAAMDAGALTASKTNRTS